ncbi:MAG: type II 3-dehydroquinate dehydratase [Bacteroidetes bacterium MED-G13]|nr:MAG: type II 3-dehydroquinate dehydratase [Bacteroidetes bacterium MED-G13]|tara:strand:- start:34155 stop:34577 length:423 start_codon:yes stop_codon:yes gene_type:complete
MKKIMIINGPNLNLLGTREVDIYGNISFESYLTNLKKKYSEVDIHFFQSNIEGELINKIQEVGFSYDGIVLNAAAYTHTSVGISDSIAAISSPVIEVHISNIHAREEFRSKSLISKNVEGIICGFGLKSYDLAIDSIIYK